MQMQSCLDSHRREEELGNAILLHCGTRASGEVSSPFCSDMFRVAKQRAVHPNT